MREIKFRAWDKKKKRVWLNIQDVYDSECSHTPVEGHTIYPKDHPDHKLCDRCYPGERAFGEFIEEPNQYSIMQYTGLKDKNDKEIYEGDIVEWKMIVTWHKSEVKFERGRFYIVNNNHTEDVQEKFDLSFPTECEVIGNIWENEELLK